MLFWKALETSKTTRIRTSEDAFAMIMKREQMLDAVEYDTVQSNSSNMDDPSSHVLGYESYWLSMSVVFTLKYILGLSICVSGGNRERKNGAPNVVGVAIFS